MRRIRIYIAYDGTAYAGWQIQENALAIEQVLNETLTKIFKEDIAVIGASRTDSGVHAFGNVAVFDTSARMPADKVAYTLNQFLPKDIRIQRSEEVAADWHPRAEKCNKTYEYKILNARHEYPQYRFNTHFFYMPLNVEKMRQAAAYLVGEHDFESFCSRGGSQKTTVRKVNSIEIFEEPVTPNRQEPNVKCPEMPRLITIRINGDGFLYNMVRIITGTLIWVGTGFKTPEDMPEILAAKNRDAAGQTAPAKGLTLVEINYYNE